MFYSQCPRFPRAAACPFPFLACPLYAVRTVASTFWLCCEHGCAGVCSGLCVLSCWYMLGSGIAGAHGSSTFNLPRNRHTFHSGCTVLHSDQQRVLISLHPRQHLLLSEVLVCWFGFPLLVDLGFRELSALTRVRRAESLVNSPRTLLSDVCHLNVWTRQLRQDPG